MRSSANSYLFVVLSVIVIVCSSEDVRTVPRIDGLPSSFHGPQSS